MTHNQPHIQKLLEDRYYLRDEEGNLLEHEPKEMFWRVAEAVAEAEKPYYEQNLQLVSDWACRFFQLMNQNKFLPNTPTLINAGKERPGCFSACFVLPVEDSMEGIFTAVKQSALIMKAGGGVGYNFGRLREKGAVVKSTGHKASGPVSFMQAFDAMIDTVAQGGTRRGAAMAVLPVWHPDIEEFIEMKDGGGFSNFNISVGITNQFMQHVERDSTWHLLSESNNSAVVKTVQARDLWNKIVEHAWKTGDPGLIFLDTINKEHPLDEEIEATNPCGEIPLRPYESCNLGSINLMTYTIGHKLPYSVPADDVELYNKLQYEFDWDALAEDIPTMVRFLDDIIDVNPFPLPEIDKASKESRKIGLGIMGWADCLIKMKIPYDSKEALYLAEELMEFIMTKTADASIELAIEKGAYPLCKPQWEQRRNATLLCVAPTGTLSRIAGVSSGIEPIFSWFTHHKLVDLEYDEKHWALHEKENYEHWVVKEEYPAYMKTANEITWEWHLAMQAAFQKHVDNSISKTINLPTYATDMEVNEIYWEAWKLGLKGITIYRDNCKENQPLNKIEALPLPPLTEENKLLEKQFPEFYGNSTYRKRGPVTIGVTHKVDTGKGKIYITINYSEYHSEPVEVFIRLGHLSTSTEAALAEYTGRLISLLLKHSVPLEAIERQGNKVYADTTFWYNQQSFCSFPKLISHLLSFTFEEAMDMAEMDFESMMENGHDEEEELEEPKYLQNIAQNASFCYNCGEYSMVGEAGCKVCQNCGYEECG